jgi:hypothetical protein
MNDCHRTALDCLGDIAVAVGVQPREGTIKIPRFYMSGVIFNIGDYAGFHGGSQGGWKCREGIRIWRKLEKEALVPQGLTLGPFYQSWGEKL